jgi:hypothetical protein
MADKHLIYFTSQRVSIYQKKGSEIRLTKTLPIGEEGAALFGEYVANHSQGLFYVLADIVEEDFAQESIPSVGGKDRRLLLQRKLAQRYRDTSLALAMSLGFEKIKERREEQILFSSFTNTQRFQPWLEVLRAQSARLVGIFSVPLITPILGRKVGIKHSDFLLISLEEAGLRQTYFQKGQVRFSRLGTADREDPRMLAETCAAESSRIQQYLINLRIIPRSSTALEAVVLIPQAFRPFYEEACKTTAALRYQILDVESCAKTVGLAGTQEGSEAETLFLHALSMAQPPQQFAADELRRFYHLWRAKIALLSVGAAAFTFCLLLAGLKVFELVTINAEAADDLKREDAASRQYASIQAQFPSTPTSSDKLKVLVSNYTTILSQPDSLEPFLIQVSRALASVPQVEIERIDWDGPPSGRTSVATKPAANTAKPTGSKSDSNASRAPAPATEPETAQISGRISGGAGNDYRAITQIVDQFAGALRLQKGIEIVSRQLPFDINAQKTLAGDIGAERATEIPRFTIILNRRGTP